MKKLIPLLIFYFLFKVASAKDIIGTYATYDDFINNTMDTMDGYIGFGHAKGQVTLRFIKDSVEKKVKCKDIWGFKLGDRLYRVDQKFGQPAYVLSVGKIIYYENGQSYMDAYKTKKAVGVFTIGYLCYFSKNMNSEMIPYDPKITDAMTRYKEFKKSNPKFMELFKCLGKTDDYSKIRTCVRAYNAAAKEGK